MHIDVLVLWSKMWFTGFFCTVALKKDYGSLQITELYVDSDTERL